jgi:transposase-like protein
MPQVDRDNPTRAASSASDESLMEFMKRFPDDAACMEFLWRERFSDDGIHATCLHCEEVTPFKAYETKQRRGKSRTCTRCGTHMSVLAGTIFEGSSTSLHLWFYAMYLMASTRCGISAKQLERELGVTYKTAWRMFNRIRNELMNDLDDSEPLNGKVEADETAWGGRPRRKGTHAEGARFCEAKPTVLGMVERGGRVRARVVPKRRGEGFSAELRQHINPDSILYTEDWVAYKPLAREGYNHRVINHSAGSYVEGDIYTNTIEGFFGNMKTGMRGAYKKVSRKWLQPYVDEYAWRWNARHKPGSLFGQLLARAASKG